MPGFEQFKTFEELMPGESPRFNFWNNFDSKPVEFSAEWPPPGPLPPIWRTWNRFRPRTTFEDPWVDAARSVILLDVQSWPAASQPHSWKQPAFIAPTPDLYIAVNEPAPQEEWLLCDGHAPTASEGLMGWTGRLWSPSARLVASGGGQALCRRIPPSG